MFRVTLNDGTHSNRYYAMLNPYFNNSVYKSQLSSNSIDKIKRAEIYKFDDERPAVVLIQEIEILQREVEKKIGNPVMLPVRKDIGDSDVTSSVS